MQFSKHRLPEEPVLLMRFGQPERKYGPKHPGGHVEDVLLP